MVGQVAALTRRVSRRRNAHVLSIEFYEGGTRTLPGLLSVLIRAGRRGTRSTFEIVYADGAKRCWYACEDVRVLKEIITPKLMIAPPRIIEGV